MGLNGAFTPPYAWVLFLKGRSPQRERQAGAAISDGAESDPVKRPARVLSPHFFVRLNPPLTSHPSPTPSILHSQTGMLSPI